MGYGFDVLETSNEEDICATKFPLFKSTQQSNIEISDVYARVWIWIRIVSDVNTNFSPECFLNFFLWSVVKSYDAKEMHSVVWKVA